MFEGGRGGDGIPTASGRTEVYHISQELAIRVVIGLGDGAGGGVGGGGVGGLGGGRGGGVCEFELWCMGGKKGNEVISTAWYCLLLWQIYASSAISSNKFGRRLSFAGEVYTERSKT